MKRDMFKGDLQKLFDIVTKDMMTEIQKEKDREFLRIHDVFSYSMSRVDVRQQQKKAGRGNEMKKRENSKWDMKNA